MLGTVKKTLKHLLYYAGALSAYHRLRNRNVLTVAMFHRVLAPADPRWNGAMPDWTLSENVFEDCLTFFERHYTIVSLHQVSDALHGGEPLPPRSLLLTFDDGYADNQEYALPALRRHGLPAALFVFSDAVGQKRRPWTEDFLHAYLSGDVTPDEVRAVHACLDMAGACAPSDILGQVWEIVQYGSQLSEPDAHVVLSKLCKPLTRLSDPAQMLAVEQIRLLARDGMAIAAHGKTHCAFPAARDLEAELCEPRRVLAQVLAANSPGAVFAVSFPYGAHTPEIVDRALQEGYRLMFTVREELAPLARGRLTTPLIGRLNVSGPVFAPHGRLQPALLAFHFFRRPHATYGQSFRPARQQPARGEPAGEKPTASPLDETFS